MNIYVMHVCITVAYYADVASLRVDYIRVHVPILITPVNTGSVDISTLNRR